MGRKRRQRQRREKAARERDLASFGAVRIPEIVETRREAGQLRGRRIDDPRFLLGGETGPVDPGTPPVPQYRDGDPAAFDLPWGSWNIDQQPRRESPQLQAFRTLEGLAQANDVLAAGIGFIQKTIAGLDWAVVPASPELADDPLVQTTVAEVERFFERPNRLDRMAFPEWIKGLVWETLVTDALTIDPVFDRVGRIHSFAQVDGKTIKPLLDNFARVPRPPEPAYQQVLNGIVADEFTSAELYYRPSSPRKDSPYGTSAVERIMTHVLTGLRRWTWGLDFYNESTLPQAYFEVPDGSGIAQAREWHNLLNDIVAAKMGKRFKFLPLPPGANLKEVRTPVWTREQDEWIARVILFELGVNPLPLVAMMNRATAEVAETVQYDANIQTWRRFFASVIDDLIEIGWGPRGRNVRFEFVTDRTDVSLARAQTLALYVDKGFMHPWEVRENVLGLPPDEEIRALPPAPGSSPTGGLPEDQGPGSFFSAGRGEKVRDGRERPKIDEKEKAAKAELERWRKVARKSLERARSWKVEDLEPELADFVFEALRVASKPEDIETTFRIAKAAAKRPSEAEDRELADPKFLRARRRLTRAALELLERDKPLQVVSAVDRFRTALEARGGPSVTGAG